MLCCPLSLFPGKHHQAYLDNMNKQIAGSNLESKSLEEVVLESWNNGSPSPVFNNAAQVTAAASSSQQQHSRSDQSCMSTRQVQAAQSVPPTSCTAAYAAAASTLSYS
jgi:superoxide dismutase